MQPFIFAFPLFGIRTTFLPGYNLTINKKEAKQAVAKF